MRKWFGIAIALAILLAANACAFREHNWRDIYARDLEEVFVPDYFVEYYRENVTLALIDMDFDGVPGLFYLMGGGDYGPTTNHVIYKNGKLTDVLYEFTGTPKAYYERRTGKVRWFAEFSGGGCVGFYAGLREYFENAPSALWLSYSYDDWGDEYGRKQWKFRDEQNITKDSYDELYALWREAFEEIPALAVEWVGFDEFRAYAAAWKPAELPPFAPDPNAREFPAYHDTSRDASLPVVTTYVPPPYEMTAAPPS